MLREVEVNEADVLAASVAAAGLCRERRSAGGSEADPHGLGPDYNAQTLPHARPESPQALWPWAMLASWEQDVLPTSRWG